VAQVELKGAPFSRKESQKETTWLGVLAARQQEQQLLLLVCRSRPTLSRALEALWRDNYGEKLRQKTHARSLFALPARARPKKRPKLKEERKEEKKGKRKRRPARSGSILRHTQQVSMGGRVHFGPIVVAAKEAPVGLCVPQTVYGRLCAADCVQLCATCGHLLGPFKIWTPNFSKFRAAPHHQLTGQTATNANTLTPLLAERKSDSVQPARL